MASSVKEVAVAAGLNVYQPQKIASAEASLLKAHHVDVMVVAAYGQIIPESVLCAPRLGCINVHASILPRWRGASPIVQALLSGDSSTGITIIKMDQGLDTGPVLKIKETPIHPNMTQAMLTEQLSHIGAEEIVTVVDQLEYFLSIASPQPELGVSYAPKIKKTQAQIDWTQTAQQISRQIHAFNPAPMAYTFLENTRIRVLQAKPFACSTGKPGQITSVSSEGVLVRCADNGVLLQVVQFPGERPAQTTTQSQRWNHFLQQSFEI
jgi:methionyl-tRNA formyltransferase